MLTLVFTAAKVALSWPLQTLAALLQLLGIALTALAVAEFRSRLELITTKVIHSATETTNEMRRRVASRRERVELWWLARRGRTRPAYIKQALGGVRVSASGIITTTGHPSTDRASISDRDWLAFLNDQVDALRDDLRAAEKRHSEELTERLAAQRDQLRTEIRDAARDGSGLVLAGL